MQVWSLALPSGWRIRIAMSYGVGCRCGSDPMLLWLWCRPAVAALIWLLAWEPPYAALRRQKKKKKESSSVTLSAFILFSHHYHPYIHDLFHQLGYFTWVLLLRGWWSSDLPPPPTPAGIFGNVWLPCHVSLPLASSGHKAGLLLRRPPPPRKKQILVLNGNSIHAERPWFKLIEEMVLNFSLLKDTMLKTELF